MPYFDFFSIFSESQELSGFSPHPSSQKRGGKDRHILLIKGLKNYLSFGSFISNPVYNKSGSGTFNKMVFLNYPWVIQNGKYFNLYNP